jgi:hypothetical protein
MKRGPKPKTGDIPIIKKELAKQKAGSQAKGVNRKSLSTNKEVM